MDNDFLRYIADRYEIETVNGNEFRVKALEAVYLIRVEKKFEGYIENYLEQNDEGIVYDYGGQYDPSYPIPSNVNEETFDEPAPPESPENNYPEQKNEDNAEEPLNNDQEENN